MILQQCSLLITQRFSNILALLLRQHHAIKAIIHYVVVMESAAILRDGVELAT